MSGSKHRDPSRAERRARWLALLGEVRAAALSAMRAAEGDGAGPDRIALAAIAGQLRGRRADEPPAGVEAGLYSRFVLTARNFAEPSTDPRSRGAQAPGLAEDALALIAAWPGEEAASDETARALAERRGWLA